MSCQERAPLICNHKALCPQGHPAAKTASSSHKERLFGKPASAFRRGRDDTKRKGSFTTKINDFMLTIAEKMQLADCPPASTET